MLLNLEILLGIEWRSKRRGSSANNRGVDIRIAGTICKLAEYTSGWRILVGLRTSYDNYVIRSIRLLQHTTAILLFPFLLNNFAVFVLSLSVIAV